MDYSILNELDDFFFLQLDDVRTSVCLYSYPSYTHNRQPTIIFYKYDIEARTLIVSSSYLQKHEYIMSKQCTNMIYVSDMIWYTVCVYVRLCLRIVPRERQEAQVSSNPLSPRPGRRFDIHCVYLYMEPRSMRKILSFRVFFFSFHSSYSSFRRHSYT